MTTFSRKSKVESRKSAVIDVTCAFCDGKGRNPFGIMSPLATCQVCEGEGSVKMSEPTVECAFCRGTGVHPNTRMTCIVCHGVGRIEVAPGSVRCPHCGGSGRTADCKDCNFPQSVFPCQHCKGVGFVAEREG